jgi:hypothetical protein
VRLLVFAGQCPVNLMVTDPQGRRVGYDPNTGATFLEIPGAIYGGPDVGGQFIIIPNPDEGIYQFAGKAFGGGEYLLSASSVTQDGLTTHALFGGTVTLGEELNFEVDSSQVIITPTPTATPGGELLPDLTISQMRIELQTPACFAPGDPMGVRLWVSNIGQAAAGSFVVEVNGAQQDVSGLAAGETTAVFFPGAGNPVAAAVDATGVVAESDEGNNSRSEMLPVPTAPLPCTPTFTPTVTDTETPTPSATDTATSTATPTPTYTPTSLPGVPVLIEPSDGAVLPQPVPPGAWTFRCAEACYGPSPGRSLEQPRRLAYDRLYLQPTISVPADDALSPWWRRICRWGQSQRDARSPPRRPPTATPRTAITARTPTVTRTPKATPAVLGLFDDLEDDLEDYIEDGDIARQIGKSLMAKLTAARKAYQRGRNNAAANQLEAFVHEIEAQRGKKVSPRAARDLIRQAEVIME